jgi:hypothetical protein
VKNVTEISMRTFHPLATRENGRKARARILEKLGQADVVELDFSGEVITPSFADECLGVVVISLGADQFEQRVHLKNLRNQDRVLLEHVVARAQKEKEIRVA